MNDENDSRNAVPPPPRPKHASLVEIVKDVVNERLDSLLPMNEEQLAILRRSDAERARRAEAEEKKRRDDEKFERRQKALLALLSIVLTALEIYRATHH